MSAESAILALNPLHYWASSETVGETLTDSAAGKTLQVNETVEPPGTLSVAPSNTLSTSGRSVAGQRLDFNGPSNTTPLVYGTNTLSADLLNVSGSGFAVLMFIKRQYAEDTGISFFEISSSTESKGYIRLAWLTSLADGDGKLQVTVGQSSGAFDEYIVEKTYGVGGVIDSSGVYLLIQANTSDVLNTLTVYCEGMELSDLSITETGTTPLSPGALGQLSIGCATTPGSWDLSSASYIFDFAHLAIFNREWTTGEVDTFHTDTLGLALYDKTIASYPTDYYNKMFDTNHACNPQIGRGTLTNKVEPSLLAPEAMPLGDLAQNGQKIGDYGDPQPHLYSLVADVNSGFSSDTISDNKPVSFVFIVYPDQFLVDESGEDFGPIMHIGPTSPLQNKAGITVSSMMDSGNGDQFVALRTCKTATADEKVSIRHYEVPRYTVSHVIIAHNGANEPISDTNTKCFVNGVDTPIGFYDADYGSGTGNINALATKLWINAENDAGDYIYGNQFSLRNASIHPVEFTPTEALNIYTNASSILVVLRAISSVQAIDQFDWQSTYTHSFQEVVSTIDTLRGGVYVAKAINETVSAVTKAIATGVFDNKCEDAVLIVDTLYFVYREALLDAVICADLFSNKFTLRPLIEEVLIATDSAKNKMFFSAQVEEFITVVDDIFAVLVLSLKDNVQASDISALLLHLALSVKDTVQLIDTTDYGLFISLIIADRVDVSDVLTSQQLFSLLIEDEVIASGGFVFDGNEKYTFVMNAQSKGLSEYSGFNFNSMSEDLLATSDGLFQLSSEDKRDNTKPIPAKMDTALLDFGNSIQKQVPYAYLGLSNTGDMVLSTITELNGKRKTIYYKLKIVTDATDTRRIKLAKGVKSRYWKFTLENKDGSDFEMDTLDVLPLVLKRRI